MQEENKSLEELKKVYSHIAFINQKFLSIQFYLEEMVAADAAMKFITTFGNSVIDQIEAMTPKETESEVQVEVEQINE